MHLFQQIHESTCCWQCFLLSVHIDLGLILHWKVGLSYTAHLTDRCKTIFSYTTKKKTIWFSGHQRQSCKNVQTVQTSRCYFFLAGANFWEKHAKNRRKQVKTRENRQKTGAFLVLIFWGEKLVGANFYAFCNYDLRHINCKSQA